MWPHPDEVRAEMAVAQLPPELFEGWRMPDSFEPSGFVDIDPRLIRTMWKAGLVKVAAT